MVSKNTMFLKTCIFWKCCKNVIQVVDFRRWDHCKTLHFSSPAVIPRKYLWISSRKDHFQKSDVFAMSKRKVVRETTSGWSEKPHRPRDPSENHANTIGKRDVFESVPVAGDILRFRARQTLEIHAFLSSPTWNWIRISINLRILVRSKKNGSVYRFGVTCDPSSRSQVASSRF